MSKKSPKPFTIKSGQDVCLKDIPTDLEDTDYKKSTGYKKIAENAVVMAGLAKKLYAEDKRSILLVLQGMDTAGKDGTIRSVMTGMNPTSCQVNSFKQPSSEELDHDFLWRIHKVVPRRGNIGIFNRSHYEDVLVVRVHNIVPKERWEQRYELINSFERILEETNTTIVKCFLHISKETQRERLQARLDDPNKHWKFSMGDLAERKLWDDYQEAYEAVLQRCSTDHAPWHVIPSDRKWLRNLVDSELLRSTLEEMDPQFPEPESDFAGVTVE
jgi:PPK2 family polyphosphate:nucleotide phosphotransferase